MKRLEEKYKENICTQCINKNDDDCNIVTFNCKGSIYCKCINYKGRMDKTEIRCDVNGK